MYMYRNKYAVKHLIYDDFNHFVPPPLLKKENRKNTYLGCVLQVYVYIEFVLVQRGPQTKNDKYFS